jgi:hypothetical protein
MRLEFKGEPTVFYKKPIHNTKINLETLKMRPAKRVYTVWIVPTEDD